MSEIKKVVLYKHGVGYFEREAAVSGNAEVKLGFRAEEMNDVLKSLTVFDSAGGTVSSVSYDNQKPTEKLLEETSLSIPRSGGQVALLHSVRGASVLVSAGNRMVSGQVVGIDERTVPVGQSVANSVRLTVLDDGGALHAFEVNEISSIRFLDEHLRSELKHVLETLLSATKRDTKNLKLFARGTGERKLSISYVVECPVWKTSYRVALEEDDSVAPFLQGWALVDNPQDEDWSEVELSLVSGLPISFVHDLYSPRYLKRKEIEVSRESSAGPVMTQAVMEYGAPGGGGSASLEMLARSTVVSDQLRSMAAPPARPPRAQQLAASLKVETVAQSVGQLFEYRIDQPVTVLRNQSALVPIVGSSFEGKRKVLYNPENRSDNPFSVLDFRNTTGLTLEGGPLTVYDNDVYAGEAMMDTLSPDEERMIPYAVDLSVEAQTKPGEEETVTFESLKDSIWTQNRARYAITRYRFHNKSDKAKELVIEHAIQEGQLVKTPAPIAETRSYWRFALGLPARATTEFTVTVRVDRSYSQAMGSNDPSWVIAHLKTSGDPERVAGYIGEAEEVAARLGEVSREELEIQHRVSDIVGHQERIRSNLGRLSQSHDEGRLRSRYVAELERQEDELARLSQRQQELKERHAALGDEMRKVVASWSFERAFEQ